MTTPPADHSDHSDHDDHGLHDDGGSDDDAGSQGVGAATSGAGAEPPPDPPTAAGHVPAPGLREVAQVRWDVDRDPVVCWSQDHCTFWLGDPGEDADTVVLATFAAGVDEPHVVATALADTLASCDFPPTDDHASVPRVTAALRVADLGHLVPLAAPAPPPADGRGTR